MANNEVAGCEASEPRQRIQCYVCRGVPDGMGWDARPAPHRCVRVIGLALAGLVALALIGIGAGALVAPRAASQQYGIVLEDARSLAFIRAMGVRDIGIGVLVLLLASTGHRDLLALGVAASAAVAGLDLAVVTRDGAARRSSRVLHGVGAIGLLIVALVIATGR